MPDHGMLNEKDLNVDKSTSSTDQAMTLDSRGLGMVHTVGKVTGKGQ